MREHVSIDGALRSYDELLSGALKGPDGHPTSALFVGGSPRSGKTTFATRAVARAWTAEVVMTDGGTTPDGRDDRSSSRIEGIPAMLICSTRLAARGINATLLGRIGHTSVPRVATTLSALAFSVVQRSRMERGLTVPRLLNGAEQESVLDDVLDAHRRHARAGELCDTCRVLLDYFAAGGALGAVRGNETDAVSVDSGNPVGTTEDVFDRCLTSGFTGQLRDILARMNEVGATAEKWETIERSLGSRPIADEARRRLAQQWRLAFVLRNEYAAEISRRFPDEFRMDSSYLLVSATAELRNHSENCRDAIPQVIVVDDAQDLTIAGMDLLQIACDGGAKVVLVAGNDEAVQTFRGSYPEFLHRRAVMPRTGDAPGSSEPPASVDAIRSDMGRLNAASVELDPPDEGREPSQMEIVASRVSLSIGADEEGLDPIPDRTGKCPFHAGSLSPVGADDAPGRETTDQRCHVVATIRPSVTREMDSVIASLIGSVLESSSDDRADARDPSESGATHRMWNDMAIIAHDNTTLHAYGDRLRALGVPIRYSSVTRSFGDDPLVQGILSLIELAMVRNARGGIPASLRRSVRENDSRDSLVSRLLLTYLSSPLVGVDMGIDSTGVERSRRVRMAAVRSAVDAVRLMAVAVDGGAADSGTADDSRMMALLPLSRLWSKTAVSSGTGDGGSFPAQPVDGIAPDTTAMAPLMPRHTNDEILSLVVCDSRGETREGEDSDRALAADGVVHVMTALGGSSPDVKAFVHALSIIRNVADDLLQKHGSEPTSALWSAWSHSGVAQRWQMRAVGSGQDADLANDRLDMAVRLLDYAANRGTIKDLGAFLEQIGDMDVVADSLAKTAPVDDAVTLTTPAGAAGRVWRYVWIPGIQRDVWPNLARRNALFGADDLADLMLRGRIPALEDDDGERARLLSILYAEQRAFLVAVTRATEQVSLSAVSSVGDSATATVPSDFLRVYLPEIVGSVPEDFSGPDEGAEGVAVPSSADASGAVTLRGLVSAARAIVAIEAAKRVDGQPGSGAAGADCAVSADGRSDEVADAIEALRIMASPNHEGWEGYGPADARNWFFTHYGDGLAQGSTDARSERTSQPAVSLSPSMVDSIWDCPVCALLDRAMSGPTQSGVSMSFGTIVHRVAQWCSEEGFDNPVRTSDGTVPTLSDSDKDSRIEDITARLVDKYRELRGPLDMDGAAEDLVGIRLNDARVPDIMRNIATYVVNAGCEGYGEKAQARMGDLVKVDAEVSVGSTFTLDDITEAYNSVSQSAPVTREEMFSILDALAGGFAEGFDPQTVIKLNARIDRLERRHDGIGDFARVIDYKTGRRRHSGAQNFCDLQLVCYQLALHFSRDDQVVFPPVSSASLFDVASADAPGKDHRREEWAAQPPLFDGDHINVRTARNISTKKNPDKTVLDDFFADPPKLDVRPPAVGEQAWNRVLSDRDSRSYGFWSLCMIARVFYAASIMDASRIPRRQPSKQHIAYCRHRTLCPWCSDEIVTVMGREEER
ncbi:PD-(D/E)XK nuclease family protein [uncultured Bifidobacterium sp.]|uniref:PD-(D/E)XK nuclease family protein n=1 Tax=uncultured Bifidobacterium sp. TaxID=165187 RepID=UPI00261AEECA|nr:PD-(D/E)XK nuclease family protein [uncultured Bifidobacterium sp.]